VKAVVDEISVRLMTQAVFSLAVHGAYLRRDCEVSVNKRTETYASV
jgi:hypothetical protein